LKPHLLLYLLFLYRFIYLPPVILVVSVGFGILVLGENKLVNLENIDELLLLLLVFNLGNELELELEVELEVEVGLEVELEVEVEVEVGLEVEVELEEGLLVLPNKLEKKDGLGSSTFFKIG